MRKNKNIRKIIKNGRGSYYVNIPKDIREELGWKERQKVVVRCSGKRIITEDF